MIKGHAKIITATLLFSLAPLFVKVIPLDGVSILWCVNLIGGVTLTIRALSQKRGREIVRRDKAITILIALGIFSGINNSLFNTAIKTTTIANAILTHYLAPVFVFIFGIALVEEKITRESALALVLSFIGLGIILSPNELALSNAHFLGLVLGTLSSVFLGFEILLKKRLTRSCKADVIMIWLFFVSVLALIPFVSFGQVMAIDTFALSSLLFMGVVISGLGTFLFTSGLNDVRAQDASILSYIEPLGAVLWGFLIIMEIPALETLLGGALILIGTYVIVRSRRSRELVAY